jgi:hypothetical protein
MMKASIGKKLNNFLPLFFHQIKFLIRKNIPVFFLLFLPVFISCSDGRSIEEDTLVKIYAEIVIADSKLPAVANILEEREKIFQKYSVTEEEYESSLQYYTEDVRRWESFFDKAIKYVEALQEKSRN